MLFKNLMSDDAKRRQLILRETINEGDTFIKTQKRCTYFVKNCIQAGSLGEPNNFKKIKEKAALPKRHYYVIKKHDSRSGEDNLFCRIDGSLYVAIGTRVYVIGFRSSFNIDVKKHPL